MFAGNSLMKYSSISEMLLSQNKSFTLMQWLQLFWQNKHDFETVAYYISVLFLFFAYLPAPIPDTSACVIDAPWSSMASKLHDMSTILNSTLGPQT